MSKTSPVALHFHFSSNNEPELAAGKNAFIRLKQSKHLTILPSSSFLFDECIIVVALAMLFKAAEPTTNHRVETESNEIEFQKRFKLSNRMSLPRENG